ncbi:DUF1731 domain-containing protein [Terrabacter carboxydivorans]|uniref:DUF1731 domain-containing protein n=1 Tax=Terrabacter carboxydivorans TaxID=619730 RepID=A0ABN3KQI6_9MICO
MTWQRTHSQHLATDPETVWSVVGDPRRWPEWCVAIHDVTLDGEPVSGGSGAYLPSLRWARALHGRTAPPLRLVAVEPPRALVVEQPVPGGVMRVEWTLRPEGTGTLLRQRVTVTGPSTVPVVLAVARSIADGWTEQVARLAALTVPTSADLLKVVVAGGSGTLGRALAADLLARGHEVVLLTRRTDQGLPYRQTEWDGIRQGAWTRELAGPARTAVVNLAGRLVDARPTAEAVADLRESRVRPTLALVEASRAGHEPLARWVQGSTTAIWSDAGESPVTESTPLPTGSRALPQMTGVAEPWEAATEGAATRHLVVLRTSIVLQAGSPALDRLTGLTRAGLGGRVGSGRQWFSWIHVEDWLTLVRAALGLEAGLDIPDGVVVAAAPRPVRNGELMGSLRRHLRRPAAPPTPELAVRVGSILLRTDPALGLTGRHCTSDVLRDAGLRFAHPTLDDALDDLLS